MEYEPRMLNFSECEWEVKSEFSKLLVYQGAKNITVAVGEMMPGGPHKPHSHLYEQTLMVVKGTAKLHINDQIYPMSPGCIMAIPPYETHMFEPTGDGPTVYVDIFSPKRPDHTGRWIDPFGNEREVEPREERIESKPTADPEKRANVSLFSKE